MPVIGENPFFDYFTIDLGTTNSAVSIFQNNRVVSVEDENGHFTFPSCVSYTRVGPIVGLAAKNRISNHKDPVIINSKRLIGQSTNNVKEDTNNLYGVNVDWVGDFPKFNIEGEYITPTDVAKEILLYAKRMAERKVGSGVMKNVVITVPAYFNNDQRSATREAARLAGLNVHTLIEEPISATLSYSIERNIQEKQKVLVFDFGGGTFDVSIVDISDTKHLVLNTDGDNCLGGSDIDLKIAIEVMNYYEQKTGYPLIDFEEDPNAMKMFNNLMKDCENAKKAMSVTDEAVINLLPYIFVDDEEEEEEEEEEEITTFVLKAEQLNEWSVEFMKKCEATILRCINDAHLQISDISQVITVGGSSYLPAVKGMLESLFPNKVYSDPHPETCVSRGAAAYLLNKHQMKKEVKMKTAYDVCLELGNGDMIVMIPKGSDLPTSAQKLFTTDSDLQNYVMTSLCQKNQDGLIQRLRPIRLNDVPLMSKGEPRLLLNIAISETSDFCITCKELTHDRVIPLSMSELTM